MLMIIRFIGIDITQGALTLKFACCLNDLVMRGHATN